MTHTPGNWTVYGEARKNEFNIWQSKVLRRFAPVARIVGMAYGNNEIEAQSNAKLMAASPTMYEYILKKSNEGDQEAKKLIESI